MNWTPSGKFYLIPCVFQWRHYDGVSNHRRLDCLTFNVGTGALRQTVEISPGLSITLTTSHENKIGHRDCSRWAQSELTVTSPWAHGELTVTKMVTASRDWAVTWAVIELWPSRDWAVIILKMPWLSCDLASTELWPSRDWAVTSPWLSCDLS